MLRAARADGAIDKPHVVTKSPRVARWFARYLNLTFRECFQDDLAICIRLVDPVLNEHQETRKIIMENKRRLRRRLANMWFCFVCLYYLFLVSGAYSAHRAIKRIVVLSCFFFDAGLFQLLLFCLNHCGHRAQLLIFDFSFVLIFCPSGLSDNCDSSAHLIHRTWQISGKKVVQRSNMIAYTVELITLDISHFYFNKQWFFCKPAILQKKKIKKRSAPGNTGKQPNKQRTEELNILVDVRSDLIPIYLEYTYMCVDVHI